MVAIEHPGHPHAHEAAPVNRIGNADLRAALAAGFRDFRETRGDLIFAGLFYPLIGFVTATLTLGTRGLPLLFPLFAGLSLMGPLVATGFYEIARRRELGLDAGWKHYFDAFRRPAFDGIVAVGALLFGLFMLWMLAAAGVWFTFLGAANPESVGEMVRLVFTTREGLEMALVGSLIGFCFAVVVLITSAVSLPMLVDRDVSARQAIATSVAAARENPGTIARWGLTVAVLLVVGAIPFLIGLAVVLPVLGYATWHLYKRVVVRTM